MLEKYTKILPHLLLAIIAASVFSIYFGHVTIKLMQLLDLVLDGRMELMQQRTPELIFKAILLVPLGILSTITRQLLQEICQQHT